MLRVGMLSPTLRVVGSRQRLCSLSRRRASNTRVPTPSVGTRSRNSLYPQQLMLIQWHSAQASRPRECEIGGDRMRGCRCCRYADLRPRGSRVPGRAVEAQLHLRGDRLNGDRAAGGVCRRSHSGQAGEGETVFNEGHGPPSGAGTISAWAGWKRGQRKRRSCPARSWPCLPTGSACGA